MNGKQFVNSYQIYESYDIYPANIYLFKVNNINTRKMYEILSDLTVKTPERRK